jgi:hypothetical protein
MPRIGTGLGLGLFRAAAGGGFDADYQAVLTYATTQGYTLPSAGQQTLQNQLVVDLKTAGVWSKLDTFANFATDGSSNFALIDWKRLSQYTAINSPTFTTNDGFLGNGTSSYIDSNFNPASSGVNYTLDNASIFLYNKTFSLNAFITGVDTGAFNCLRMSPSSGNQRINMGGSGIFVPLVDFDSSTFKWRTLSRTSATNVVASKNTTQTTHTATSVSIESQNQLVLRSFAQYAAINVAVFGMGASLVSENTAFYNAINTYITSI